METKNIGWPIALAFTAVVTGGVGFYVGGLSARLSYLEQAAIAPSPASNIVAQARSPVVAPQPQYAPQPQPQAFAATPTVQPYVAPQAPAAQASDLNAEGVPVQAAVVLDNPELAARLIVALDQTTGVQTQGTAEQTGKTIYAFIDPRCPFCLSAAEALVGNVPVKWISTTLLGDTENGLKIVEALQSAEDPTKALEAMHDGTLVPIAPSMETREAANENAGVLYSIFAGAETSIAVPTILVPEPDGTIKLFRGFGEGDGQRIMSAYGG